jgi:hypothetical protein
MKYMQHLGLAQAEQVLLEPVDMREPKEIQQRLLQLQQIINNRLKKETNVIKI